ncbi:tape measure protein [Erwinia sp. S59]|uniref:tape measure protein n=1 Tax=Erwinia sp. S59 TaxID=2769340 RepID=UPI00190D6545|nr:tape measure protein [Erwinia sp. S59]MBK0092808.1 tape measure protein [Erwinia sp. S59]
MGAALGALASATTIKSLLNVAESMQNLQARVGNATGDLAGASEKLDELAQHAKDSRSDLDVYVDSWAKMNQGIAQFGGSSEDTTKFVDTLSAAFKSNGTSTQTANAALFQLAQTMQGGVVQGEEMNSLIDAQGSLYHDIAVEIAGSVPAYKKMQAAGAVTSKMLMDAVNKQYPKYMKALKDVPRTVSDSWRDIKTDFMLGVKNVNNQMGIIPKLAAKIDKAWKILKTSTGELIKNLGGLEGAIKHLSRVGQPLAALLAIFMGFKALSFLTSPIALIGLLATAIGLLWDDYKTFKEGGKSFIDWDKWGPEIEAAKKGVTNLKDEFVVLKNKVEDLFGFDFSKWNLKDEIDDAAKHIKELTTMLGKMGELFSALQEGRFLDAAKTATQILTQKGEKDALPGVTASGKQARADMAKIPGLGIFFEDRPDSARIPSTPEQAARRKRWGIGGDSGLSSNSGPSQQNISNSGNVSNVVNVYAAPGQSPQEVADAVAGKLRKPTYGLGSLTGESMMNFAGAK